MLFPRFEIEQSAETAIGLCREFVVRVTSGGPRVRLRGSKTLLIDGGDQLEVSPSGPPRRRCLT